MNRYLTHPTHGILVLSPGWTKNYFILILSGLGERKAWRGNSRWVIWKYINICFLVTNRDKPNAMAEMNRFKSRYFFLMNYQLRAIFNRNILTQVIHFFAKLPNLRKVLMRQTTYYIQSWKVSEKICLIYNASISLHIRD